MRKIKFRAWYSKDKSMMYDVQDVYDYSGWSFESFIEDNKSGKCVLMQYTGLKDINSVEIYEGDIIYYHILNWKFWRREGNW